MTLGVPKPPNSQFLIKASKIREVREKAEIREPEKLGKFATFKSKGTMSRRVKEIVKGIIQKVKACRKKELEDQFNKLICALPPAHTHTHSICYIWQKKIQFCGVMTLASDLSLFPALPITV